MINDILRVCDTRFKAGKKVIVSDVEWQAFNEAAHSLSNVSVVNDEMDRQKKLGQLAMRQEYLLVLDCNYKHSKGKKQIVVHLEWERIRPIISAIAEMEICYNTLKGEQHEI